MSNDAIIFEEISTAGGQLIGIATLNSEKSLNALTQEMINLLLPKLQDWKADSNIAAILLKGSGSKALCAGGDIINLRNAMMNEAPGPNNAAEHFFYTEYVLNYTMHTYPKPILCWGHGIVMGGGLGLMASASHRVVTEKSRIAMPEIGIGLYPDVGGTWFLPRMPGYTGLFLGLTGASMNAGDALFTGIADYYIENDRFNDTFTAITEQQWSNDNTQNHDILSTLLRDLHNSCHAHAPASKIEANFELINRISDHSTLDACLTDYAAIETDDSWLKKSTQSLATACPISAYVCFEQYKRGKHLSLKEAFLLEWKISIQVTHRNNFSEGVRALLVDKDQSPKWEPASFEEIDAELIEAHFSFPDKYKTHPLKDL